MNRLVTTAIVGTGQIGNNELVTNTPIDALTTQLPEDNTERSLLLTAGARAVYHQAGYCAEPAPAIPQSAPPEELASCSAKAALLLVNLLQGGHKEVLIEALERMRQANLRLPHELLPQALAYGTQNKEAHPGSLSYEYEHWGQVLSAYDAQNKEVRSALVPVLGERGHWLSQLNQEWKWVNQLLLNAETIWQEGTFEQRYMVLRKMREIDPIKARDWLAEVWKQEKAETRTAFITTFEVNLSLEDEPFLEKSLDDRSTDVRSIAVLLLARIPGSALAQRMQSRADAILTYVKGKLTVTMLQTIDEHWKHDGMNNVSENKYVRSPLSLVPHGHWEQHYILFLVPPSHWEQRFATTPEKLIAAIKEKEYVPILLESWSKAAFLHNTTSWISPLLEMWQHLFKKSKHTSLGLAIQMITRLPQHEAENIVAHLLFEHKDMHWIFALPRPWSHNFGETFLEALQDHMRTFKDDYEWKQMLDAIAIALPESCFERALQPWEIPEEKRTNMISWWRNNLTDFSEVIRTRKQIMEEIV